MRRGLLCLAGICTAPSLVVAQSPVPAPDTVYVVEYYYTARWGYAEEF